MALYRALQSERPVTKDRTQDAEEKRRITAAQGSVRSEMSLSAWLPFGGEQPFDHAAPARRSTRPIAQNEVRRTQVAKKKAAKKVAKKAVKKAAKKTVKKTAKKK